MIHKGRKIKVNGDTYMWRLSASKGRFRNTSGKTATLTVQHAEACGALLRVMLTSSMWTDVMDWDDNEQVSHRVSFTPADVVEAIQKGIAEGWKPTEKGKDYKLRGHEFTEYFC